jgi:UDP-3-O-[3-hydroxymyristoyl] glucosamine N-acyltransferase
MEHPGFFERAGPFPLTEILKHVDANPAPDVDQAVEIRDVKTLDDASVGDISFLDNPKYVSQFKDTSATACLVGKRFVDQAPERTALLICSQPYRSFAQALTLFYPGALLTRAAENMQSESASDVDPSAELEDDVRVEPGAVIGREAHIGSGTTIAAGAVIGYRVHIGRNCYIGPNASITHALIGNNVILHAGVCVGQDGFGFAMGPRGHLKVPQIGRVIIQDSVEIGANTTVDRGAIRDTIIGEGTKIDNLVQIGHNVTIGRHCVIVAQTGISGSTVLEDFVAMGGQCGVIGHVRIGMGAQIAATSNVNSDVPPGARWGGTPAKPVTQWFREITILKKLSQQSGSDRKAKDAAD